MSRGLDRRQFLGAAAGALFLSQNARAAGKPLRGIFPIMQTPFTEAGAIDHEDLASEVRFLNRVGAHGMVWPQLASEYFELKWEERIAGAETIMKAARGERAAVILGVQAPDVETAVKYAKHAAKLDPNALIAIPPREAGDKEKLLEYYKAIGAASLLPVFMQSVGDISVDEVIALAKQVPTLRYVKDEAGHTLSRIPQFRARAAGTIQGIFTGAHGRTLIDEMARGAAGSMPASGFTDLYVTVWDLWQAGRRAEALDAFGRLSLAISQVSAFNLASMKYWLQIRGVFKTTRCRGKNAETYLDDDARRSIRATYEHLRPYLKG